MKKQQVLLLPLARGLWLALRLRQGQLQPSLLP